MAGSKFISLVMYVVLLVTFLGLLNMIFNLHRFAFYGEFLVLLGLLLAAIISAAGIINNMRWAWILLMLFFAFAFIDVVFISMISARKTELFLYLVAVVIAGFFISLFSITPKKKEDAGERKEKISVEKSFKPGKYIASKSGTKFHAPKCDWAKKVKKENAVWFESREDAEKAGYKADTCIN